MGWLRQHGDSRANRDTVAGGFEKTRMAGMKQMDLPTFADTVRGAGFFEANSPIAIARAPGRLDVMGGIADYSGALVLQRTIAEATFAAVQKCAEPRIDIVSLSAEAGGENRSYSIDLSAFSEQSSLVD